jgi:hypothetical protein
MLLVVSAPRGAAGVEVFATAQVAAAPERVFAVLTKFGEWQQLFSGFRVLHTEQIDARSASIRQLTRVVGRPVVCTMAATLRPEDLRLDLVLDEDQPHDVDEIESQWRIHAIDGGAKIELRVMMRSGLPLPAFLEQEVLARSTRRSLDDLVRAVEATAQDEVHADTWSSSATR